MANIYFQFKEFIVHQDHCAMKVTTDSCLFGAWAATQIAQKENTGKKMLDIGCGTGLLSLMAAQKIKAQIDAVEIEINAFVQATENFSQSPWHRYLHAYHNDIKDFYPSELYDFIICNPPFYEKELHSTDKEKNIAHHSAEITLNELLKKINELLKPSGSFFLLLPYKRKKEICEIISQNNLSVAEEVLVKPSTLHNHFRMMIAGTRQPSNTIKKSEIAICDSSRNYTKEFISLLKDYYLYL